MTLARWFNFYHQKIMVKWFAKKILSKHFTNTAWVCNFNKKLNNIAINMPLIIMVWQLHKKRRAYEII